MQVQDYFEEVDQEFKNDIISQQEEEMREITEKTPPDLLKFLNAEIVSTDVLIDGVSMATQISEGISFVLHGLLRTRAALEASVAWISAKYPEAENELSPLNKSLNKSSHETDSSEL